MNRLRTRRSCSRSCRTCGAHTNGGTCWASERNQSRRGDGHHRPCHPRRHVAASRLRGVVVGTSARSSGRASAVLSSSWNGSGRTSGRGRRHAGLRRTRRDRPRVGGRSRARVIRPQVHAAVGDDRFLTRPDLHTSDRGVPSRSDANVMVPSSFEREPRATHDGGWPLGSTTVVSDARRRRTSCASPANHPAAAPIPSTTTNTIAAAARTFLHGSLTKRPGYPGLVPFAHVLRAPSLSASSSLVWLVDEESGRAVAMSVWSPLVSRVTGVSARRSHPATSSVARVRWAGSPPSCAAALSACAT